MDYEIEILREIVIKHIEEVCGKLHPDGYYSTEYHVSSRNYSFGHTVYALVGAVQFGQNCKQPGGG